MKVSIAFFYELFSSNYDVYYRERRWPSLNSRQRGMSVWILYSFLTHNTDTHPIRQKSLNYVTIPHISKQKLR